MFFWLFFLYKLAYPFESGLQLIIIVASGLGLIILFNSDVAVCKSAVSCLPGWAVGTKELDANVSLPSYNPLLCESPVLLVWAPYFSSVGTIPGFLILLKVLLLFHGAGYLAHGTIFFTEASPCLTHQSVLWSPVVLRTILFRQKSLSPGKKILLDGVKASIYWRLESRIEISRQWNIVKGNQVVLACYMECHMLTIGGQNFHSKFRSNSLLYHSPDRSLLVNWNYHCHQI